MNRISGIICAVAASVATPASAQLMGASELKVAVPVKGAPSTQPVADLYYLVGESGSRETYTLTAKGPASITLFGPDGAEILTASGSGSVKLEAILPFTDVFTIAIARKSPTTSYSLSRKATVPTLMEAELALGVGYGSKDGRESQCWLIPAVKLRQLIPMERRNILSLPIAARRVSSASHRKALKPATCPMSRTTSGYIARSAIQTVRSMRTASSLVTAMIHKWTRWP